MAMSPPLTSNIRAFANALVKVVGLLTALLGVVADAHSGCRQECFDRCTDAYRRCTVPCAAMPDGEKREKCFSDCMRENGTCEEHCDKDHHDPVC